MVWLIYNHNEFEVSKNLLLNLVTRKWPGTIVVLDDSCAPDQLLKNWLRHYPLPYLYVLSDEYLGKAAGYDRMVQTAMIQGYRQFVITDTVVKVSRNFIAETRKLWRGKIDCVGGSMVQLGKLTYAGGGNLPDFRIRRSSSVKVFPVQWLSPVCLIFTANVYATAGSFARGYYQGMWSVDWCERTKRAGYTLRILPVRVVVTRSKRKEFLDVKGAGSDYFSGRNGWLYWHYRKPLIAAKLYAGLGTLTQWRSILTKPAYRSGMWDGWRLRGNDHNVRMDG